MPRVKLVDAGLPYKKIMQGSKWIGRVYKNASGTYTGQIGKGPNRIEVAAPTERAAFSEVAARYFGQPDAAALAAHNSQVRAENRAARPPRRRFSQATADEMLRRLLGTFRQATDAVRAPRPGRVNIASPGTGGGNPIDRNTRLELEEDDFMRSVEGSDGIPPRRRN